MPVKDIETEVYEYPMAKFGVNLYKNLLELRPEECIKAQNLVWKNGMVKRRGQSLLTTTEVVTSKRILGLHRFYKSTGVTQTLSAADTLVKYFVSPSTWTSIGATQTTGLQTYMTTWGPLDKVYITNGTDVMKSWSGSALASITIADGVPVQALPYQDRLLTIIGGDLIWSASYDDTGASWETIANCGVRPDTILHGMTYHSVTSSEAGYEAKVLLAGANGMYIFSATDLRTPSTIGDYTIYPLAINIGCESPRTIVWTPKGTFWLGIDKKIYMLPFGSVTPIPVGTKINSNNVDIEGIETIPDAEIQNACAIYHDGYYKLSCSRLGQTDNNVQWWLDVDRLYQDEDGHFGPWYGPMLGQTISCFSNKNGPGDIGQLEAGEATAKGYVYEVGAKNVYGDIDPSTATAQTMRTYYQSYLNPLGSTSLRSDVHKVELELLNVVGNINVEFHDFDIILKSNDQFTMDAIFWDEYYWDEIYWSSSSPVRSVIDISPAIQPRRLSVIVWHEVSNDVFELYSIKVKATEQSQVFG